MPATFTPRSVVDVDRERKDPGFGGRPPVDRRPTGGGGGDENWDHHRHGRGPRALLTRYRMGIFSALAGDLMFFMALVTAFFFRQSSGHFDGHGAYILDWHRLDIPPILYLNTAILILSSVTMEMARRQLFHEVDVMEEWLGMGRPAARRAAPWLAATVALGIAFLVGQWMAWKDLASQGFFFASNPSSHFFYLITGAHGAHLILGVLALVAALAALSLLHRMELRQIFVDCTAWYWHSMGIFWVFLFSLLVFFQ
ncbi:MAG TPA: cytochrome c oxidase subunit 3 [Acidobacteriaceae bacterium]|jgi:cytochrome c oxidase subunit 3